MRPAEQTQVSNGLSDIIDRFKSLGQESISSHPPWPQIRRWREDAHDFFKRITSAFVKSCEYYLRGISTDPRSLEQWRYNLEDLWERLDKLRSLHNCLFGHDYGSMIYHHIFIDEMFACLPEDLPGAKSRFLIVPSDDLSVWPVNEALIGLTPRDWFDATCLEEFENLEDQESSISFECHREMDFERQTVLAHEIFHIIVRNRPGLRDVFARLASKDEARRILGSYEQHSMIDQIEELFCDFAARWYYGPVYMQAFADEISYYRVQPSPTHPPNDIRAHFLLGAARSNTKHRGYRSLRDYLRLRKRDGVDFPPSKAVKSLAKDFAQALTALRVTRFGGRLREEELARSFALNIPFVVKDIRIVMNSLPPKTTIKERDRYSDFVCESLRKSNIMRQASEHVRHPDLLFASPEALASAPVRRKRRKR